MIIIQFNGFAYLAEVEHSMNENSIDVSHSSIQEIADSTESTAEAIQKQAVMCSNIQGNTDAAEAGIHQMIKAASFPNRQKMPLPTLQKLSTN